MQVPAQPGTYTKAESCVQGRSQDLVSGGAHPFRGGGPTPYFSPQTPNHKGPPLMYFWLPPDFGGGRVTASQQLYFRGFPPCQVSVRITHYTNFSATSIQQMTLWNLLDFASAGTTSDMRSRSLATLTQRDVSLC